MVNKKIFSIALIVCILGLYPNCKISSKTSIKVMTTTSMLGSIVQAIGKEKIKVVTIVPAGMCPDHLDIKPGDVRSLNDSRVLVNHGWEQWIDKLCDAADSKPLLHTVDIKGNLMIPRLHKKAAQNVTALLCSLDKAHTAYYEKNLTSYTSVIDSLEKTIKEEAKKFDSIKIICSKLQVEFLNWLGFDVVMTYPRAEELTPKILSDVIHKAKKEKVIFVIDNLQSGPDTGWGIAEEIGARHIVLTNFPLRGLYPDALMENFKSIMQVLNEMGY